LRTYLSDLYFNKMPNEILTIDNYKEQLIITFHKNVTNADNLY